MKIISLDFEEGYEIPKKFGYNFDNINPRFEIVEIPRNTESLAIIMDDPDAMAAVGKVWVHWLICNIDPTINLNSNSKIMIESNYGMINLNKKNSSILGKNDFGKIGYGGPSPPDKCHMYFFKIFALDSKLTLSEGYSIIELETAMKNHIIQKEQIIGKFCP